MKRIQTVEGFVLKRKILLEKDIRITLFTREEGKTSVLAKGARTLTSRRAAHLQTGNLIRATVSVSNDRYYVRSTDLVSGFLQLRTEQNINGIYLFLSVIDYLLPEGQQEESVYKELRRFFIRLGKGESLGTVLKYAIESTLMQLGYIHGTHTLSELLTIVEENSGSKLPRHDIL